MKVQILGSGAADGVPGLFSKARVSEIARRVGGKEVRTRSSALVDDWLKIDFPCDTFAQCATHHVNPRDWGALAFTHSHDDHLAAAELQYALYPFVEAEFMPFPIYGNRQVIDIIKSRFPDWPIELNETRSFRPYKVADYMITPVFAHHDDREDCQNLIISHGGKTFFYATDTGVWGYETWAFLKQFHIDGMVIECTDGFVPSGYCGHLSLETCIEVCRRLKDMGTLAPNAPIATTHHSANGNGTYDELAEALRPHGIAAGYDGMILTI